MADPFYVTPAERSEMIRAHAGVVASFVQNDAAARAAQLASIVDEHLEASEGDLDVFRFRMMKQLEADAWVSLHILKSLAPMISATDDEAIQKLAEIYSELDLPD